MVTAGPVTPDHVIWTKIKPLILPIPITGHKGFSERVYRAVEKFENQYLNYYHKNNKRYNGTKEIRDAKAPCDIIARDWIYLALAPQLRNRAYCSRS